MVGHKISTLKKSTMDILKMKYANDVFTTLPEAVSRSIDMGLDGVTHVYSHDGQAVYMPAESHEAYLDYYEDSEPMVEPMEVEEKPSVDRIEALRAIVAEVLKTEFHKADYQGESVTLNKPRRTEGGNKKFEVFVKDGDRIKRVTLGTLIWKLDGMILKLAPIFALGTLVTLRKIKQLLVIGLVVCGKLTLQSVT